jgi:biopolymer transport protein ExbD
MRIPSVYSNSTHRPDVAMTPMIDVVFLLLIFFLWTASFQIVELQLPSKLSKLSGAGTADKTDLQREDFETVIVRIQVEGTSLQWSVNNQPAQNLGEVRARLKQVASIRVDLPVLVDPDQAISLGDVLDVYDAARQEGFTNIQFTTRG